MSLRRRRGNTGEFIAISCLAAGGMGKREYLCVYISSCLLALSTYFPTLLPFLGPCIHIPHTALSSIDRSPIQLPPRIHFLSYPPHNAKCHTQRPSPASRSRIRPNGPSSTRTNTSLSPSVTTMSTSRFWPAAFAPVICTLSVEDGVNRNSRSALATVWISQSRAFPLS
jgi:hypothetical protein